jgi:hypothetical protein
MPVRKIVDETCYLSARRGNGILRREVWVDQAGGVVRYCLAYINHAIHAGDNGRVVGYDNAHDVHHRHYFGEIEQVSFRSFEDIEERFERD